MEFANRWTGGSEALRDVRRARHQDARAITNLLRQAAYSHIHADWHYPADWLGSNGFVVLDASAGLSPDVRPEPTLLASMLPLRACLAVAADPPPAAWVRVAAMVDFRLAEQKMSALFAAVNDYLKQMQVTQLFWLLVESWPDSLLSALGFEKINFVETYIKNDASVPDLQTVPGLIIRPVRGSDMSRLERIERDAFAPLWRHSAASLRLAWHHALSFDVAELDGELVGFQFSSSAEAGAHLARMTVAPARQGMGIGAQLLAHACGQYRRLGITRISLNTQADNVSSQKLYRGFGFRPTGQRFPIWAVNL